MSWIILWMAPCLSWLTHVSSPVTTHYANSLLDRRPMSSGRGYHTTSCHRLRFFGTKSAHIFLCSSWSWTMLFAPLSGKPCSLRFMYYVLSDTGMHISTTLSPAADVPGRLDRCSRHLCPAVIKPTPVYITLHVVHTHPQRLAMNYHHQYENSHKIKQKLDPTMPFDITSGFSPARSLNRFTTIRLACGAVSWPHDDTGDIYVPAVG
jgi:hypothetical protein